jgi:hypothetical protein
MLNERELEMINKCMVESGKFGATAGAKLLHI